MSTLVMSVQGFPKSCSYFLKILATTANIKSFGIGNNGKNWQGLVAKVKDTVANG